MRSSRNAEPRHSPSRSLLWWACSLFALVATAGTLAGVCAAGFQVERAETRLVDGVLLLDANIGFEFSEESLEALNSGVALTVIVEMDIVKERKRLWDKRVARLRARHQLQVHALSGQYIVKNLNSGATHAYRTRRRAMTALGRLKNFPVLDSHLLEKGQSYKLKLRARLDIEALPAPMRPAAYLSSLWRQSSEWSTWPLIR